MISKKVAVVTGANRGLGLGASRELGNLGFKVILLGRNLDGLKVAAEELKKEGSDVEYYQMDVTHNEQINILAASLKERCGRVDVLINNAGVFLDSSDASRQELGSVLKVSPSIVAKTYDINALGPLRMIQAFLPIMLEMGYGRIVNVSSGMGGLNEMEGGAAAYRMSKAALNALTKVVDAELKGTNVKINSVCPGWVRTDMGGPNAQRTIEEGVKGIIWAATLPDDGPSGGFFRDGKKIEW